MRRRRPKLSNQVDRELASLADRSLQWDHRSGLLVRLQGDPALRGELALQRRAVELIVGARRDPAPSELHDRVALLVNQADKRRAPLLRALLRVAPVLACTTAAILALTLPGDGAVFTLGDAVALTKAPVLLPPPLQSVEQGAASRSGWRPEGMSVERISGRLVTTTFYASREGKMVGYATVGGPPLNVHGGVLTREDGIAYRHLQAGGRNVTTWVQSGHTHVLSGNVGPSTLLRFATLKGN